MTSRARTKLTESLTAVVVTKKGILARNTETEKAGMCTPQSQDLAAKPHHRHATSSDHRAESTGPRRLPKAITTSICFEISKNLCKDNLADIVAVGTLLALPATRQGGARHRHFFGPPQSPSQATRRQPRRCHSFDSKGIFWHDDDVIFEIYFERGE